MALLLLGLHVALGLTVPAAQAADPQRDLCAALRKSPVDARAAERALGAGAVATTTCPIEVSYRTQHWDGPEVLFGILFPPYGLGKLVFGGESHTRTEQVPPLLLAVGSRDGALVGRLLAAGAPANTGEGRESALGVAVRDAVEAKRLDVVRALLDAGADPTRPGVVDAEVVYSLLLLPGALEALAAHGLVLDPVDTETALERAIRGADRPRLERLLVLGADPDGASGHVGNPLAVAVNAGDTAVVERLLAAGATVARSGPGALAEAAGRGDLALTRRLLDWGAPVAKGPVANGEGADPPLFRAAGSGNVEVARLLLERGAPVDGEGSWERTALNAAAARGDVAMVQMLLAAGADVHHVGFFEHPAIEDALSAGSVEVVKLLLAAGSPTAWEGRSALVHVGDRLTPAMLDVLVGAGLSVDEPDADGFTALDYAVLAGKEAPARLLLAHGAALGATGAHPRGVLHAVARRGNADAVKLALTLGAPLEAKDNDGHSALWVAVTEDRTDVAEELLRRGADLHTVDARGRGLVYAAAAARRVDILPWVLARGLPVDGADAEGHTPLHQVAGFDDGGPVEALLAAHAAVDPVDAAGRTPLFDAARGGHRQPVAKLLAAGARVDRQDREGSTPLHVAVEAGGWDAVDALLHVGARVDVRDAAGRLPLDLAVQAAPEWVVKDLLPTPLPPGLGPYTLPTERWAVAAQLLLVGVPVTCPDLASAALEAGQGPLARELVLAGAPVDDALLEAALVRQDLPLADAVRARLPAWTPKQWREARRRARWRFASDEELHYLTERVREARRAP
jgi:ankyrin repeat protein